MSKIKKRIAAIGIILLCVLAIFTFVSHSFYDYNMPRVTTGFGGMGPVDRSISAVGHIVYPFSKKVIADGAWTLATVNVANGDAVKAGDVLCTFDTSESDYNLQSLKLDVMRAQAADDGTDIQEAALALAQTRLNLALAAAPPADGLAAPCDGTVFGLTAASNDTTYKGEIMMTVVSPGTEPRITFTLPPDPAYSIYSLNTTVVATVMTETAVDGIINYSMESGHGNMASGMIQGGEWVFQATLKGLKGFPVEGQEVPLVATAAGNSMSLRVPVGALFDDGYGGKCVYIIGKRAGLFGDENYVTRTSVVVYYDNGAYACVSAGSGKLVLMTTKPILDGDAVWVNE